DWMSQVNQISDKCQESWRTMVDAVGPLYGRASAAKASGQERLAASAAEVNAASDALEGFAQSVRRLESEFKTLIPPTACSNSAKAKYADCLGWFKFLSQGLDTPLLGLTGED